MATFPTIAVRIAFANDAFAPAPTWYDVSAYVRSVAITRGRQYELDRAEAGEAVIEMNNTDRRFWPGTVAGPYYLNVLPSKRLQVWAAWPPAVLADSFTRPADSWVLGYGLLGQDTVLQTAARLGYTEIGTAIWTSVQGDWITSWIDATQGYRVVCTSETANDTVVAESGLANAEVECEMVWSTNAAMWIVARYADADNMLVAGINGTGNLRLIKRVAGVDTAIDAGGFALGAVNNTQYSIRLAMSGSDLTVYVNDALRITASDAAGSANTKVGFRLTVAGIAANKPTWNNLSVRAFGATGPVVVYPLHDGWIERWDHHFRLAGGYAPVVTVTAVDLLKGLATYDLNSTAGYASQLSNLRIAAVLDDLPGFSGVRSLDTGQTTVMASGAIANTSALEHIRVIEESEGGLFFIGPDGAPTFQQRHARYQDFSAAQGSFGDTGVLLRYLDIGIAYDDQQVYNDIRLTRTGGTEQVASDATSKAAYGPHTLQRSGLQQTTDAEVLSQAGYLLGRYKDAALRVASITINPRRDTASLWPRVLLNGISTRIAIDLTAASISGAGYHIERIEHRYTANPASWRTVWQLSPADAQTYFTLDLSTLGQTTRLGY